MAETELKIKIDVNLDKLNTLEKELGDLSKEMKNFGNSISQQVNKEFEKFQEGLNKSNQSSSKLNLSFSTLVKGVIGVGGALASAGIITKQFFDITAGVTFEVAKLGDELIKASKKTG